MQIDFLKLPSKVNPSLGEGRLADFIFGKELFILVSKYEINKKFKLVMGIHLVQENGSLSISPEDLTLY